MGVWTQEHPKYTHDNEYTDQAVLVEDRTAREKTSHCSYMDQSLHLKAMAPRVLIISPSTRPFIRTFK